jgi:hypothetical protein
LIEKTEERGLIRTGERMDEVNMSMNGTGGGFLLLDEDPDFESSWEVKFQNSSRFWVQRVLVPIVVLFGALGNLITIYILTRRPMRSSTNV